MDHWGFKSYENDGASDAIDAGFEHVHGDAYNDLMDDGNPITYDDAQRRVANPETLAAGLAALQEEIGPVIPFEDYDDEERLAFVGVVVRHAEFGVAASPDDVRRAIDWIEHEPIEWDEPTLRNLRKQKEIALLNASLAPKEG